MFYAVIFIKVYVTAYERTLVNPTYTENLGLPSNVFLLEQNTILKQGNNFSLIEDVDSIKKMKKKFILQNSSVSKIFSV